MRFDEPQDPHFEGLSNVIIFDDFFNATSNPKPIKEHVKKTVDRVNLWIGIEPPVVQVTLPGIDPLIS
jgi:hypothetical protein